MCVKLEDLSLFFKIFRLTFFDVMYNYQKFMLKGLKLLDMSRIIVGPYASMVLSDFGVQVIKIQSPDGDPTRQWGPPWHKQTSAYFHSVNRNKRSLTLNLKNDQHRQVLYKLASRSDAVIENFVPGVTEHLKIDYENLRKFREDIVYCSISGYGDIGPMKNSPAFDNIIQAQSGFMSLTGSQETGPFKMGFAITDVLTGLYAANAVLAGLMYRNQTSKGIHLKTSLFQCAMASLINQGSNYLNGKTNPKRLGNHHPNIVPYGIYKTKDSQIIICVGTPHHYKHLIQGLSIQNLPKFSTNQLRVKNRVQFDQYLNLALSKYQTNTILQILIKRSVPCGKVNSIQQAFNTSLAKQLNIVHETDEVKYVRSPIRYEGEQAISTAPPKINEHGRQILAELGYKQNQISDLLKIN